MNILKRLEHMENATASEQVLINFILSKPNEFLLMKPKELSSILYISPATLYRLINKLQLHGVNELKLEIKDALRIEHSKNIENMDFPILPTDSVDDILLHLKEVYQRTIDDTYALAHEDTLIEVCNLMQKAHTIDVYASAGNLFFADNFKFQMQEIGIHVNVPHEEYMVGITASNSGPDHLSLVISFGGRGKATNSICSVLHELNSPIILITSTKSNPLTKYAHKIIYMSSYEDHYQKVSSFSTRMTLLYILDTLYSLYFSQNYSEFLQKKITSYQRLSKKAKRRM